MRSLINALFYCCAALFISMTASARQQPPGTFFQRIDVTALQGASFTLEGWMYPDSDDPAAETALMVLTFNNDSQSGTALSKRSMRDFKPREWNRLIVSGKIDARATSIAVGGYYSGRGKFVYDDLKLVIKKQEITLDNKDFEASDLSSWKFFNQPASVKIATAEQQVHGGKQALMVDASGVLLTSYGRNEKAGHYANINGSRIYYEEYGEGAPLLLLHGALESIVSFEHQIPVLAKSYHVIAVDTRGHGKSTADTSRLTYDLYAEDMYTLLHELKLDSVNVLGWSDGGNTGLILAMRHPEKVRKLVTMGANLSADTNAVYGWVLDTVRNQIKTLQGGDPFAIRVKLSLLEEPNINPEDLKAIKCPVLITAGEYDVIKEAHTRLIAGTIPHGQLKIFKGASHDAPREVPDAFNRSVEVFLHER